MKTKLWLWIGAAALLIALVAGGLPLFSRLYYGRSQAATLLAWQLKKEAYTTEEAFQSYLEEERSLHTDPYVMPAGTRLSSFPAMEQLGGVDCYILNPSARNRRIIVYFPGGSYIDDPRAVHWQFLDGLAGDSYSAVVVPFYPKLPDACARDAYGALLVFYRELTEEYSTRELIFMGDSAGGGMALSLAMQLRDLGRPGPEKLILICPWLDVSLSNPEIPAYEKRDPALDSEQLRHLGALWAEGLSLTDPVVSPLYGSLEDLGRITLLAGTDELLCPDILRLDGMLTDGGIDHDLLLAPGMFHVWPLYRYYRIPEAESAYRYILDRISG